MDLQKYLDRIHYQGEVKPNLNTLRELQRSHMQAVPFENLSIHYNQPIVLDEDLLFKKVIGNNRGGFCYELNGLFAKLLEEIGFKVTRLSAGVAKSDGTFGPEFDHLTLLVHLDETHLVDVGFGESFQQPLLFKERGEQNQGDTSYQIIEDGDAFILMEQNNHDKKPVMRAQYRFALDPHELAEYVDMCRFHQTSSESSFTKKRICSMVTHNGRVSLSEMKLIVTKGNVREETELKSEEELLMALKEHFEIEL